MDIRKFISKNTFWILFLFFFIMYFSLGLKICFFSENIFEKYDIIFNADCPRVYSDFLKFSGNHYRIVVHPLQLILLQPIFNFLKLFIPSPRAIVFLVQAICSAGTVCLIAKILELITSNRKIAILTSVIYGLGFSTLIFTSIPETYVFAAFFNAILFYYLCHLFKKNNDATSKLDNIDILIITVLTIFAFGIIPASILPNFILIIWLLFNKAGKLNKIFCTNILKIIFCLMLLFAGLNHLQKQLYQTPYSFSIAKAKTETQYINKIDSEIDLTKIKHVALGSLVESYYAVECEENYNSSHNNVWFIFSKAQDFYRYIPAIVFWGLPLLYFISNRKKYINYFDLLTALILICLVNFTEFYYYCNDICFLYSLNILLYLTILFGILISEMPISLYVTLCIAFTFNQCFANFPVLFRIEKFLHSDYWMNYHTIGWLIRALVVAVLAFDIIYFGNIIKQKILKKDRVKNFLIITMYLLLSYLILNYIFLLLFERGN